MTARIAIGVGTGFAAIVAATLWTDLNSLQTWLASCVFAAACMGAQWEGARSDDH